MWPELFTHTPLPHGHSVVGLCGTDDYDESGKAIGSSNYLKSDLFDLPSLSSFCCLQRLLLELHLGMLLRMAEPSLQPRIEDNFENQRPLFPPRLLCERKINSYLDNCTFYYLFHLSLWHSPLTHTVS